MSQRLSKYRHSSERVGGEGGGGRLALSLGWRRRRRTLWSVVLLLLLVHRGVMKTRRAQRRRHGRSRRPLCSRSRRGHAGRPSRPRSCPRTASSAERRAQVAEATITTTTTATCMVDRRDGHPIKFPPSAPAQLFLPSAATTVFVFAAVSQSGRSSGPRALGRPFRHPSESMQ